MRKPLVILFAMISAVMLMAIACGSDEADPNATATPAPPNTVPAEQRAAEPTAVPATKAPAASGAGGALTVAAEGETLTFDTASLSATSGSEVTITFDNPSAINSHNLVIVKDGTKDQVATDGITAGPDANWVAPGDDRVIANTVVLSPGASGEVTFTAPAPGTYQFVCTFPGHNATMFGDFTVN